LKITGLEIYDDCKMTQRSLMCKYGIAIRGFSSFIAHSCESECDDSQIVPRAIIVIQTEYMFDLRYEDFTFDAIRIDVKRIVTYRILRKNNMVSERFN